MSVQQILDDLTAASNSLGKLDENDGTYMKDRDCKPCLREIMRQLHGDTKDHIVRKTLGQMNIIKSDLIPIMNQYCDFNDGDQDLFAIILRLSTNLTSSALLLFEHQEVPNEPDALKLYRELLSAVSGYKQAFADDDMIWKTLNTHIRHTEDEIPFERLIILIRNILHIPVDASADLGVHDDFDAHDKCIYQMDRSGMLNTLIHIASDTKKGTEFCFSITEIIYLILRDKNPVTIASAKSSLNKRSLEEDDPERKRYLELSARNRRERERERACDSRAFLAQRFRGGNFVVKNYRSVGGQSLVINKAALAKDHISFDEGKTPLRKSRTRKSIGSETSAITISDRHARPTKITYCLKLFCKNFVTKVYAHYMQQIKHNLIQKKAAENDETYYLWAIQFFTAFSRHLCMNIEHISETLSASTIHFIQILISSYQDKLKLEKNRLKYEKISKRLHLGVRAYGEVLSFINTIQPSSEFHKTAEAIKKNVTTELLLTCFQEYDEPKYSISFLEDLIRATRTFLDTKKEEESHYCCPDVIRAYCMILKRFDTNGNELNSALLDYFQRLVFNNHSEGLLFQASIMRCFLNIMKLTDANSDWHKLIVHVIGEFGRMANKRRWMYQELLFWKTTNDIIEIENAIDPPPPPAAEAADIDAEDDNWPKADNHEDDEQQEVYSPPHIFSDDDDEVGGAGDKEGGGADNDANGDSLDDELPQRSRQRPQEQEVDEVDEVYSPPHIFSDEEDEDDEKERPSSSPSPSGGSSKDNCDKDGADDGRDNNDNDIEEENQTSEDGPESAKSNAVDDNHHDDDSESHQSDPDERASSRGSGGGGGVDSGASSGSSDEEDMSNHKVRRRIIIESDEDDEDAAVADIDDPLPSPDLSDIPSETG